MNLKSVSTVKEHLAAVSSSKLTQEVRVQRWRVQNWACNTHRSAILIHFSPILSDSFATVFIDLEMLRIVNFS